jgi:hypothetical protein
MHCRKPGIMPTRHSRHLQEQQECARNPFQRMDEMLAKDSKNRVYWIIAPGFRPFHRRPCAVETREDDTPDEIHDLRCRP